LNIKSDSTPSRRRVVFAYLLGMLFFGYAFVQRVAPSVVTEELMRDFAVGAASLGILSGAYFYTYAAIQLPVGLLTDRFGPRKLMSAAVILCALASIGFAYSDNLVVASMYRALIGGAVAFGFVGTLSIIAQFFSPSKFAMLAGLVQSMGMIGAIAGQAPLRILVEHSSWQETFLWLAAAGIVLGVLLFTVVPRRTTIENQQARKSIWISLSEVASNPQSWLCAFIGFGLAAPMLSFAGLWGIPWLEVAYDFDKKQAAGMVALLFIGWAFGSPLAGWVSDRTGRRKPVLIGGGIVSMCSFLVLVYLQNLSPLVMSILFALCGAGGSVMAVIFGSVREANDPANSAAAMGFANMFVVGSGAVMQPLIGWLLEKNWNGILQNGIPVYSTEAYGQALSALAVGLLAAIIAAIVLKETFCKNRTLQ